MHVLLLDNFDSFTYNLRDYLLQAGASVTVVRNDVPLAVIEDLGPFDGVVLSPGPGVPAAAGVMPALLAAWHQRVPMLGVCLGYQALGEFFGATLVRAHRPMHGKVGDITWLEQEPLAANLPARMAVTRYHSLILQDLPPTLLPLAYTSAAPYELMALRHRTLPLFGVQFHPEALLTTHGRAILGNWVKCCIIAKDARPATAGPVFSRADGITD